MKNTWVLIEQLQVWKVDFLTNFIFVSSFFLFSIFPSLVLCQFFLLFSLLAQCDQMVDYEVAKFLQSCQKSIHSSFHPKTYVF